MLFICFLCKRLHKLHSSGRFQPFLFIRLSKQGLITLGGELCCSGVFRKRMFSVGHVRDAASQQNVLFIYLMINDVRHLNYVFVFWLKLNVCKGKTFNVSLKIIWHKLLRLTVSSTLTWSFIDAFLLKLFFLSSINDRFKNKIAWNLGNWSASRT